MTRDVERTLLLLVRAQAHSPRLADRLRPLLLAVLLAELVAAGEHEPALRRAPRPKRAPTVVRSRLVARTSVMGRRPRG